MLHLSSVCLKYTIMLRNSLQHSAGDIHLVSPDCVWLQCRSVVKILPLLRWIIVGLFKDINRWWKNRRSRIFNLYWFIIIHTDSNSTYSYIRKAISLQTAYKQKMLIQFCLNFYILAIKNCKGNGFVSLHGPCLKS